MRETASSTLSVSPEYLHGEVGFNEGVQPDQELSLSFVLPYPVRQSPDHATTINENASPLNLADANNGRDDGSPEPVSTGANIENDPEKQRQREDNLTELHNLRNSVGVARNRYARLSAGRGRRYGFSRRYGKNAVGEAFDEYTDSRQDLIRHEKKMALAAGVKQEALEMAFAEEGFEFAIGDAQRTVKAVHNQRLLATGSYVLDDETKQVVGPVEPKTTLGRAAGKFYKWWGQRQNTNSKLFSRTGLKNAAQKSTVLATMGFAVGVPAALAGTVLLGPIAGGALGAVAATKIARGVMANHISRRGRDTWHVDQQNEDLKDQLIEFEKQPSGLSANRIYSRINAQTENERHYNRRRILASAAIAAAGGFVGQLFAHDVLDLGAGGHGVSQGAGSPVEHALNHKPEHTPQHGHPGANHQAQHGKVTRGGGHAHRSLRPEGTSKPPEITLRFNGDTDWNEVHNYLHGHGYDASDQSVQKVTNAVVNQKGGPGWAGAHYQHVGDTLRIPPHILEQISKVKKS